MCFFFFFKQKTAYEMRISDWSSDVCSSDLAASNAVEKAVRRRRVDLTVLPQKHVGTGRLRNQATIVEHKGVGIPLALGGVLGNGANHEEAGRLGSTGRGLWRGTVLVRNGIEDAVHAGRWRKKGRHSHA